MVMPQPIAIAKLMKIRCARMATPSETCAILHEKCFAHIEITVAREGSCDTTTCEGAAGGEHTSRTRRQGVERAICELKDHGRRVYPACRTRWCHGAIGAFDTEQRVAPYPTQRARRSVYLVNSPTRSRSDFDRHGLREPAESTAGTTMRLNGNTRDKSSAERAAIPEFRSMTLSSGLLVA
jgi:hypothetical protein